tara:strand:- start:17311 stop:17964 length:654 start_codon:yes stop_codon:yes gene_type:complete
MPKAVEKKKQEVVEVETQELTEAPKWQVTADDIDIPRLNIKQKSSQFDAGEFGSLVSEKTHVILDPGESTEVIVVNVMKAWRELTDFGGEKGRVAYTEEAYKDLASDSEHDVIEFADITMLFSKPDGGDETAYPFPIGDKFYSMGKLDVSKGAYRNTFKRLATFAAFNPDVPLTQKLWTFKTELLTRGQVAWYSPSLTIAVGDAPKAVVDFMDKFTS